MSVRLPTKAILLLALLIAAALPGRAQQYHVRQYTVEEGLPSAHVRDVTQDSQGRIWFATRSGVATYDGLEWTTYNVADGLTWADQFALEWDAEGMLWSVGAISPFKIFYLDQDRWNELAGPEEIAPDLRITAFAVLGASGLRGTLALGTDKGGLLLRQSGSWRRVTVAEGLPSNEIRDLVAVDSRLIVGTSGGLVTIEDGAIDPTPMADLPDGRDVRCMALETGVTPPEGGQRNPHTERLWLLGDDWIGRLEAGQVTVLESRQALDRDRGPWVAEADRRGGIYFGNSGAFYHYHPEDGLQPIDRDNGILADGVTALNLDREDNLWIGTERGATKLISRRFARYSRAQGLFDDEVTAVLERRSGEVVLGHRGGVSILTGSAVRTFPLAGGAGANVDRISGLAEDHRGNLWLAAGTLGLGRIDPRGQLRWFGPAQGLTGSVTSVLSDSRKRLWAATEEGLRFFDGTGFATPRDDAPRTRIRRIFESSRGELLVAASSGLYRFSEGEWRSWSCPEGSACNSVFAVLEQADGSFLVGTSAGLHRTEADVPPEGGLRNTAMSREATPGLGIDRPIYFLVRDTAERLWFGTDDGVLRWNGSGLEHFTVEDGLAGRETHRAAGMVDSRGRIWIGTERGVTAYSEPRPGPRRGPPIVSLTGIDVSGRLLPMTVPQRFGHDENDLNFRFRAVSLLDEDRILISSWLEGFESAWRPPYRSPNREIRYTNLPPGRYVLHLKAANAEGTWSDTVSSAALVIELPFWQRTWFFLVIASLVAASLYAVSSHQSQRKYSRRLEIEVAERVDQLMTEKERLALTLRNIGDGVITTGGKGEILLLNRMAEEITGWPSADAVGTRLDRVLRLHEPAPAGNLGRRLALPGPEAPDIFEQVHAVDLVTRRGDRRLVELSGSPILQTADTSPRGGASDTSHRRGASDTSHRRGASDTSHRRGASDRYTGQVLAFRDVTEKRKIESELARGQKLEALGLLAGGIAHDFNNLLTIILGNVSILGLNHDVSERTARHLADAETAVLRARDLTQQLLTFSRGGAPVRKAGSISDVIRESASFVMSGSNVRCEIELPADLWVVDIDAGQISQVVNNLLINAIQAMPDGGTVSILARNTTTPSPSLPGGKYIAIDVVDHGIGIPESHQSRVFDPYFSTKEEGRGLGLASAYSIAKQHEGLLTVESQSGEGTVFSLYLPASKVPVADPTSGDAAELGAGGRILIMDDEDAVRHVTGSIIEQLGFEAAYAIDGQEAIDRYRHALDLKQPYDAVIMDLTIPGGMGGQEAIGHLLDLDPAVRAVVMSGYSNDPVLANYRQFGFQGVIGKPFAAEDLARVLSEVL